jgi:mannose-6-phosphate isomerase
MNTAYKLQGIHRHYEWGGSAFIPQLMQLDNTIGKPFAEYWMGAHPSASALVATSEGQKALDQMIQENKAHFLGSNIADQFGTLPYLFKILDVEKMLSIQVHPSKENAEKGFLKEQLAGVPIDAAHRNYKDQNHKPEVMVALSDFWLLHGFMPANALKERLANLAPLQSLLDVFGLEDYAGLYGHFMRLDQPAADKILKPLLEIAVHEVAAGKVDKSHPHWWANKYYGGKVPVSNIDKGILSIYLLNIVNVPKYQGVFQGAGLLHAYLEGQNIELMANSDNVLRGGLTPKHIDIEELLEHIKFEPTYPNILNGDLKNSNEVQFSCPVPDFGLTKITLSQGEAYTNQTNSFEMFLVMQGEVLLDGIDLKAGELAAVKAGSTYHIQSSGLETAVIFKSFVP